MLAVGLAIAGAFFSGPIAVSMRAGLGRTEDISAAIGVVMIISALTSAVALGPKIASIGTIQHPAFLSFVAAGILAPGCAQIFFSTPYETSAPRAQPS